MVLPKLGMSFDTTLFVTTTKTVSLENKLNQPNY